MTRLIAHDVQMWVWTEPLRMTYDDVADAAYICIDPDVGAGGAVHTVPVDGGDDPWMVDSDGRIIGLEVLDASKRLPAALLAERLTPMIGRFVQSSRAGSSNRTAGAVETGGFRPPTYTLDWDEPSIVGP